MASSFDRLQLQSAFSYVFKDPAWVGKVAIYVLVMFSAFIVPILPSILLAGYGYLIMEKIILENGEPVLPEWKDFNSLFNKGWKIFAVSFLYALPAVLIFMAASFCMMSPMFVLPFIGIIETSPSSLGSFSNPIFLSSLIETFSNSTSEIMGILFLFLTLSGMALFGIGMLVGVPTLFAGQVAVGHVVANQQFSAAFKFKEIWQIFRSNWKGYFIVFLIQMGCSMAISIITQVLYFSMILCCLAPIITLAGGTYMALVSYPLYARAYRQAVDTLQTRKEEHSQVQADLPVPPANESLRSL